MNPQEMSNYIKTVVKYNSAQVTQTFIEDITVDEYPLVAAVDRASKSKSFNTLTFQQQRDL